VTYYLMDVVLIKPIEEAAAPPPGELPIYTNALADGWGDWSYDVEVCVCHPLPDRNNSPVVVLFAASTIRAT